jgi:hypothetical protein
MLTTFEAGAVFKIVDWATPVLRELSRETARRDKVTTALRGFAQKRQFAQKVRRLPKKSLGLVGIFVVAFFGCPSWIHIEPCAMPQNPPFDRFWRMFGNRASLPRRHGLWELLRLCFEGFRASSGPYPPLSGA